MTKPEIEELILAIHKNSRTEQKILLCDNKNITYLVIHAGQPWLGDQEIYGIFSSPNIIADKAHRCIREVVPMFGHNDYNDIEEFFDKYNIDQDELKFKLEETLLKEI